MSDIIKLDKIELDNYTETLLEYKLKSNCKKIGRFLNIDNLEKLRKLVLETEYSKVLTLPKSKSILLKTSSIDIGYKDYLPIDDAIEYSRLGLLDENLLIELMYSHGNIFSYIIEPLSSLDKRVTISRDTYVFLNIEKNKIWDIKIGKVCNPNFLYYREELDKLRIRLKNVKRLPGLNRLEFSEGFFERSGSIPF